jgi:hypothetical protein
MWKWAKDHPYATGSMAAGLVVMASPTIVVAPALAVGGFGAEEIAAGKSI